MKSAWQLTTESLKTEARHLGTLLLVTAVVAVPINLASLYSSGADVTVSAYSTLASVLMNIALIWTVLALLAGKSVKLSAAYYQGTASFVRFILASALLIVELVPLALGLLLYSVGVLGAAPGTSLFEKGALLALALLLAAPSVWMVNRSLFGLIEVVDRDTPPLAAVRTSWGWVKGQSWQVLGRLAALIIITVLLLAVPAIILVLVYGKTANRGFLVLLQVLISLFILPFIIIYLAKLRQELGP